MLRRLFGGCIPDDGHVTDRTALGWRSGGSCDPTNAAIENFSEGAAALGETRMWEPVGPNFGPWQNHSMVDLVLHVEHELAHRTGEIGLLRDLYAVSGA